MFNRILPVVALVTIALFANQANADAGKCGKGKRWDADSQTCVPKRPSTGSGSHSGT